ncbi:MFS transporter [Shigella flexneri]|nr:MFS transporter [Shigella flexneri]
MTDGYVLGVIGYAIIQLTPAMQLTPFMAGMIGGSALLGLFLGSLVLGWISDHIGRQKIFTFSFLLITLASFLQFFATTPEHLIGLRILIGIGLGGDYSVGHTLLAEFSPRRHRGILLGAFSVVWTVGYVLASIAGHHFISENPEAWRWLLASAALPALLITLLRWGTPESPRWLLCQGRFAEAHAIVHRYFGPHVLLGDEVVTATHKHIKTLFSSRYWRRTAFNSVFFVCLVIPWFVIYTWLPTIAQTIGLEDALTASLMLNALLIVGALLGLVLTHLLAHRKFLLGSFLLLAEMLGWPCFTQVERFTLDALFITLEQRTEHGLRCCRVRLPAVIAVRQCGEVALPVPGMRQRMAAGKAEIIRKTVAAEMPAMQCLQLARAEQRRGATLIDGQTVAEKAQKLWQDYLRQRMQP